jgi:glycosyltransferase involved in cell wall biosynthesis
MTPRVSILLPFFNAARFVEEAIGSVKSQIYYDWELLLLDDGSTDASTSIAEHYAKVDPSRIFVIRHGDGKNHGLPITRNLGLCRARGEFVALIDSDDVWLPHKLDRQVTLLDQYPEVAMVYGRSEYWYDWAPQALCANRMPVIAPGQKLYVPPELLLITHALGKKASSPPPSDLIFRRDAAKKIGGFVDEFVGPYGIYEDIAFLTKMFLSYPVYVSDECWDRYRLHSLSMTALASSSGDRAKARSFYFLWLASHMRHNGIVDKRIWRLYRARTWEYRHPHAARLYRAIRGRARPLKGVVTRLRR